MSENVIGAVHALTGRQWKLGTDAAWPDLEIVIPFNRKVIDRTGVVIGPVVGAAEQGGYRVSNELTSVQLEDLVSGKPISPISAVWAGGPGGDTARLHLLARDPFSWMTPHTTALPTCGMEPQAVIEQRFGMGIEEVLAAPARFGETTVLPMTAIGDSKLLRDFEPLIPTRILRSNHFMLQWQTDGGDTIPIDRLSLFLIGIMDDHPELRLTVTTPGHSIDLKPLFPLHGDLWMMEATVGLVAPVTNLEIQGSLLLVYGLRYREARPIKGTVRKKTILVPGRYRLNVRGRTTAQPPIVPGTGTPAPTPAPISWGFTQEFSVRYPEMLRPYIGYTTIGDNRLFAEDTLGPDPSIHGIGFPMYTGYLPYIRFIVPYISDIFGPLTMQFTYEDKARTMVKQEVTPAPDPDDLSWLPPLSKDWIITCGGPMLTDEEVVFTTPFTKAGPCAFTISFTHPTEGLVELDRWSAYISKFASFADHLSWSATSITTTYDAKGRHAHAACPKLTTTASGPPAPPPPMPDHWKLPAALAATIGAEPTHFFRFAQASGARFTAPAATADPLTGICDVVASTTVEAVLDDSGRPVALWLRTPEAIDWRRVSGTTLLVKRVAQTGACPTDYAPGSVTFNVTAIPGPDGASAFLVAMAGPVPVKIPRGEATLSLNFKRDVAELPKLRPGSTPPPTTAALTFVQPFGLDWMAELPPSGGPV